MHDLRGWWEYENVQQIWGGWPPGSKLCLLTRAKILGIGSREGATVTRVQQYIQAATQPFIDNKICSRIDIAAQQINDHTITARMTAYRGPKTLISLQFQALWTQLQNGIGSS